MALRLFHTCGGLVPAQFWSSNWTGRKTCLSYLKHWRATQYLYQGSPSACCHLWQGWNDTRLGQRLSGRPTHLMVMILVIVSPFMETSSAIAHGNGQTHEIVYEPSPLSLMVVDGAFSPVGMSVNRVETTSPPLVRSLPFPSFARMMICVVFPSWTVRDMPFSISLCFAEAWQGMISPMLSFVLHARSTSPASLNMIREWCWGCSSMCVAKRAVTLASKAWRRENWASSPRSSCMMRSRNEIAPLAASRCDFSLSRCWSRTLQRECSKPSTSSTICSTWASTIATTLRPTCRISSRTPSARWARSVDTPPMIHRPKRVFKFSDNILLQLVHFGWDLLLFLFQNVLDSSDIVVLLVRIAYRCASTTDCHVTRTTMILQLLTVFWTRRCGRFFWLGRNAVGAASL